MTRIQPTPTNSRMGKPGHSYSLARPCADFLQASRSLVVVTSNESAHARSGPARLCGQFAGRRKPSSTQNACVRWTEYQEDVFASVCLRCTTSKTEDVRALLLNHCRYRMTSGLLCRSVRRSVLRYFSPCLALPLDGVAPDQPRPFPIRRDPRGWAFSRSQARPVGEIHAHDADALSETDCSRD